MAVRNDKRLSKQPEESISKDENLRKRDKEYERRTLNVEKSGDATVASVIVLIV